MRGSCVFNKKEKDEVIEIWTDGACVPNPGKGGWAWVRMMNDERVFDQGSTEETTNNRMELLAIIMAIQAHPQGPLKIWSDSQYCVQGANSWRHKWKRLSWLDKGKPRKNADLWMLLSDLLDARQDISLHWVRGHDGNQMNDLADLLANRAAGF